MEKRLIRLIGIGPGTADDLTARARQAILSADRIAGARRMLALADELPGVTAARLESFRPEEIAAFFAADETWHSGAVLLSGDVGFYSGADRTEEALRRAGFQTERIPGISSLQMMCAGLSIPWAASAGGTAVVSLHGEAGDVVSAVRDHRYTFVLPGRPADLAGCLARLSEFGFEGLEFYVGERLGAPEGRIRAVTRETFDPAGTLSPCCAMIGNPDFGQAYRGEIPDDMWIRGAVPMTKSEVRDVAIAKLRLPETGVLYDIGAGTGSVGIQAALAHPGLTVYAVERNPEAVSLIERNRNRFRAGNVRTVSGTAPEALADLPAPDAAFVGGSSGNLREILPALREKNPEVRIVLTFVSLENLAACLAILGEMHRAFEAVQISAAVACAAGSVHLMRGQNPVTIVTVL